MSRPIVELGLFGMEKEISTKSQFQKLLQQQRSFRGIQSAISKIDPQVFKSVIVSGATSQNPVWKSPENAGIRQDGVKKESFSVPSTPKENQNFFPNSRVLNQVFRPTSETPLRTAPLTIFYNGTVSVFDVPHDQAARIIKFAEEGKYKISYEWAEPKHSGSSSNQRQLLEALEEDLPIARKKSLQRFLEKRRERLTSVLPYASPYNYMDKKLKELVQA